jgi:hypothetical protein
LQKDDDKSFEMVIGGNRTDDVITRDIDAACMAFLRYEEQNLAMFKANRDMIRKFVKIYSHHHQFVFGNIQTIEDAISDSLSTLFNKKLFLTDEVVRDANDQFNDFEHAAQKVSGHNACIMVIIISLTTIYFFVLLYYSLKSDIII